MKNQRELVKRVCWSFLLICIVQVGKNVNIPGFNITDTLNTKNTIFEQFLSTTTGGRLAIPTLFSLGMSPYMTGLIIWSMITMIDTDRINQISIRRRGLFQKLITLVIAILQAVALTFRFQTQLQYDSLKGISPIQVLIINVVILTTGAMFISWLADINCEKGIGAQTLFIIPGLITNLPGMLVSGHASVPKITIGLIIGLLFLTVLFIYVTLFLYNAEYRIKVQRTGIESRFNNSYIPIRLLTAGAMPFMFAITIFSIPQLLLLNPSWANTFFSKVLSIYFSFSTVRGIVIYGLIIFLLGLGFSFINIRPHDIAKSLKKSGDYIFDVIPGRSTEEYIQKKLMIIASVGNTYLVLISTIPLFIGLKFKLLMNLGFYFGSLFMLIVILDTLIKEVRFIYFKNQYNIF